MFDFDLYMNIFNFVSVLMNPRVAIISLAVYAIICLFRRIFP